MKIVWPAWRLPLSMTDCTAATPTVGKAEACSKVSWAGLATIEVSSATTISANAPEVFMLIAPSTSSPGLNCVTPLPTVTTVPAKS